MKRFLKYDTEDAKNGLININRDGVMYPEIFTVNFTPVAIDGTNYAIADKTREEISEAYFSGKQINASIVANGGSIPLIVQFGILSPTFYCFMITQVGIDVIKEIGINVIGEPRVAPVNSGYDEIWSTGSFTIRAAE